MRHRLLRLLHHRWVDDRLRRQVPPEALDRLEARVARSEQAHTGEIRLCIEAGLPNADLWRGASARDRAVALFGELGVWDTEQNNGVLIYLLLAEHAIELVADRGLARHVDPQSWAQIVKPMESAFREGRFEDGLAGAIDAVDALLVRHFPAVSGQANPDELANRPLLD